ncbi:hypothetical protein GO003_025650 [Methylicorpusculum oleiharenae]|uniref:hypothetical protein n=1 Tax=Methylicorpusculum oleiharenae TaxID=1338687 RepID=UPI001358AD31|nr:hypothetical protein [Methylicorpusculum oleiharenae]MCD2453329.1 hypothetical protein [Methylicorpusculum oleiharenae]MCD2453765.1 hypothetical protein [Methylicorpusculum oleiharenae]
MVWAVRDDNVELGANCGEFVVLKRKNDAILIEAIKDNFGFEDYHHVAIFLGVNDSFVSQVRAGSKKLGLGLRLKVLDRLGRVNAVSLMEKIATESIGKKLLELHLEIAQNQVKLDATGNGVKNSSAQVAEELVALKLANVDERENYAAALLTAFKYFFRYKTNQAVGDDIGLDSSTVSKIQNAKLAMGEEPLLRMLYKMEKSFDLTIIDKSIESNDFLLSLIKNYKQRNAK